jgi:hypothetical protein
MVELYSDRANQVFDFDLTPEGTNKEISDVRIIATFEKHNRDYIFFGKKINENGKYRIEIPPLKEVKEDTIGKLKLEVVAEDMIFNPWATDFTIKSKKEVRVNEVNNFKTEETPEMKVTSNVVETKKEPIVEKKVDNKSTKPITEKRKSKIKSFSEQNTKKVKPILENKKSENEKNDDFIQNLIKRQREKLSN